MRQTSESTDVPAKRLLLESRFRYLWAGQVVSQVGDGLNKIALLWFTYQLTGSALQMTLIGVLQSLPPLLLSPVLGVFIDRLSPKKLLITLDLSRVVLVALFPVLYYAGVLTLPVIYTLVFVTAVAASAFGPTMASMLPRLVRKSELTAANGLIQTATIGGVLVGPAVGGLLTAYMGAQNVLFVDSATFLVSAACLSMLRLPSKMDTMQAFMEADVGKELGEGLRFIFLHRPMIRRFLTASALYAAGVGAFPLLLPIFAKVYLHAGSKWLGWLWSALGVGMVLVTSLLAGIQKKSRRINLIIMGGGAAVAAVSVVALGHVPIGWMALIFVGLVGAGTALFTPIMWTLLQDNTPATLRGRVFTLVATTDMAAATMSMALMGLVADRYGPTLSLEIIGVLFACTAAFTALIGFRHKTADDMAGMAVAADLRSKVP